MPAPFLGIRLRVWLFLAALLAGVAALLFPMASCPPLPKDTSQAKNTAVQITTAIQSYGEVYGHLPAPSGKDTVLSDAEAAALMMTLCPSEPSSPREDNPRGIVFIEIPKAKHGRNGVVEMGQPWLDPWGNPYRIALDGNGDGALADPENGKLVYKKILVWSQGDPKKLSLVKSWD